VEHLLGDLVVPDDRTGDQLREQRNKQREVERVLQGGAAASSHIDDVAHRLEREKRNTDRERDAVPRDLADPKCPAHRVELGDTEVGVFEPAEDGDVGNDRPRHDSLSALGVAGVQCRLCRESAQIVDADTQHEDQQKAPATPCIKDDACSEKDIVAGARRG